MAGKSNETKARQRYVDQPGQWVDTTPASVKKRQENAWKELYALMGRNADGNKKPSTRAKKK